MNKFDMRDITEHCYHDGIATELNSRRFRGIFPEDETEATGLTSFCYYFKFNEIPNVFEQLKGIGDAEILEFEIIPSEQHYEVKICLEAEKFYCIRFRCEGISCKLYRYEGMSYKNVYDSIDFEEALRYVSNPVWHRGSERMFIADDLTIEREIYRYEQYNALGRIAACHSFGKYRVLKNGMEIHSYLNNDDQAELKEPLILHSNGRRYLAFKVGLYGISYLDPDSGEVYNYVPEGYTHDYRSAYGESFIITDIHYDKTTNFVAYGGCYWAGTAEVYVGDLRNPLRFDPHLLSIRELIDPQWEVFDDMDFVRWDFNGLTVNCDGKEFLVSFDMLRKKLALTDGLT